MPVLSRARDLLLALAAFAGIGLAASTLLLVRLAAIFLPRWEAPSSQVPPRLTSASIVLLEDSPAGISSASLESVMEAVGFHGAPHQVIVVGSERPETQQLIARRGVEVVFVPVGEDGLKDSWRRGTGVAANDVVVLLSGDRVVCRDFLAPLLSCFEDPRVFAAAPRLCYEKGASAGAETGKTRGEIRHGEIRLWKARRSEDETAPQPVLWTSRKNCALRRDRLLELGGFDPLFSDTEYGDADLGLRAWKAGWLVLQESRSALSAPAPANPSHQTPSLDSLERDRILFNWKNLTSTRALLRYGILQAARLLADAFRGQLNLRPLRFALGRLPQLLALSLSHRLRSKLSDEEAFRISSHRYFLARHQASVNSQQATVTSSRNSEIGPLRVLLFCPQLPYPPTHGAAVRMWNLLKVLGTRHQVDILSFCEPGQSSEQVSASVEQLRRYCRSLWVVPRRPVVTHPALLDRTVHVEMFDCSEMREALLDLVDRNEYDIIQFDKTELAQYALPRPAPTQILVEHIVFYHAYRRQFLTRGRASLAGLIQYLKLQRYEVEACRRFDGIVTMSRVDADFLRARLPALRGIVEVPNGVDTGYYRYAPDLATGSDLLFVGNFEHSPNVDGMAFFLERVFPQVRDSAPETRLMVVGPDPHHLVEGMVQDPSVIVTGLVEDTRPYLEKCPVFVAPILAGSGTRLKILEAMSSGIPVVSTTVGAEGLEVVAGTHLLIADDPAVFAKQVLTLLRDPDLRQRLRSNARSLVEGRYDWSLAGESLERVYRESRGLRGDER